MHATTRRGSRCICDCQRAQEAVLAKKGKTLKPEEREAYSSMFTEVYKAVDSKQLRPLVRTQYMRTAFQVRYMHACMRMRIHIHMHMHTHAHPRQHPHARVRAHKHAHGHSHGYSMAHIHLHIHVCCAAVSRTSMHTYGCSVAAPRPSLKCSSPLMHRVAGVSSCPAMLCCAALHGMEWNRMEWARGGHSRNGRLRGCVQIPFDSSVRLSLDTNLCMIKENPEDGPSCAATGRWYRDPLLPPHRCACACMHACPCRHGRAVQQAALQRPGH